MIDHVLILLIPGLPLLAAVLIGAFGPRLLRAQSHWAAIALTAASFVIATILLARGAAGQDIRGTLYTWFAAGPLAVPISYHYDPLAAIMLFTVTLIGTIVMIYSRGYMRSDPGYVRFFAVVALFVFAMTTLVLADNFVLLFLGWEGVGVCSYLLIGHYYPRPKAAAAAKKAFIVNRVGDFGFLLGILLVFSRFGSLDFDRVLDANVLASAVGERTLQIIAWLILAGAVGKSGQLLLHVWLPDAMEGPSPVSALIHAATMVTAGVYLVARTTAIFHLSGMLPTVAILGVASAFFAAVCAMTQVDLKRALAYSTISQIGYMFIAVGVGVAAEGVFHLFTHAFFKALLFLAAGAVMHALAGELDIRRMGGLRRRLPLTSVAFLAGALALAGIPPFAGFFSKDPIIAASLHPTWIGFETWGRWMSWLPTAICVFALITAALTGFYAFRLHMRVFAGPELLPERAHGRIHRMDGWMAIPMVLLAIGAVSAGWFSRPILELLVGINVARSAGPPESVVGLVTGHVQHDWVAAFGLAAPIAGALLAWWLYGPLRQWSTRAGVEAWWPYQLAANAFYVDRIYDLAVVRPLRHLARLVVRADEVGIDGALVGITWLPRGLGWIARRGPRPGVGEYALAFVVGLWLLLIVMAGTGLGWW